MKTTTDLFGKDLQWQQPRLTEPLFQLRKGEEIIANLKFKNAFGSYAEGTLNENTWTFKTQGFLKTHATIREKGRDENVALYRNNTWSEGGTLELPGNVQLTANSNYWDEQFEFVGPAGQKIMQFTTISGMKLHANFRLPEMSEFVMKYPWMILLGWYLVVMISRDGEIVPGLF